MTKEDVGTASCGGAMTGRDSMQNSTEHVASQPMTSELQEESRKIRRLQIMISMVMSVIGHKFVGYATFDTVVAAWMLYHAPNISARRDTYLPPFNPFRNPLNPLKSRCNTNTREGGKPRESKIVSGWRRTSGP